MMDGLKIAKNSSSFTT